MKVIRTFKRETGCKLHLRLALFALLTAFAVPTLAEINFYPPVNLSYSDGLSFNPSLVTQGDNLFVTWDDNSSGVKEVMFARSRDKGENYTPPKQLSSSSGQSSAPDVAVDSHGRVHVVWQDTLYGASTILYVRSEDGGKTFSQAVSLSGDDSASVRADILVDSGNVIYVAWTDTGTEEVIVTQSVDGGDSFQQVAKMKANFVSSVRMTAGGDRRIHVAWTNAQNIYHMYSRNGGRSFSRPVSISASSAASSSVSLAADAGSNVYIGWSEQINDEAEIYVARSEDGGQHFAPPGNISRNPGSSIGPDLTTDTDGVLYVVWQDTTPGNYEAMFAYSTDRALTFSPAANISPSELGSLVTRVAVNESGGIFVAWDDNRSGNFEIIVARGMQGLAAIKNATAKPSPFSPNGDGSNDTLRVRADFTAPLQWEASVLTPEDEPVNVFRGNGERFDLTWDGLDHNGVVTPDGSYRFLITGVDLDGVAAAPAEVYFSVNTVSDSEPPQLLSYESNYAEFGPDGDGRRDNVTLKASFNKNLDWTLSYQNRDGVELFRQQGSGVSLDKVWDGRDFSGVKVADDRYVIALSATDTQGISVNGELRVIVDTVAPQWANISVTPEVITPNGDQSDDKARLEFDLNEGALTTVYVYEARGGSLVRELYREPLIGERRVAIDWDGRSGTGNVVAPGKYIFKVWMRDYAANRAEPYPVVAGVTVR
ncbi:protein containing BNR/Asp-box repeats [Hahella chejuensis KCTC 2396]|uniref:Protein containing BNR/Asp-box repeats n=1 Tax=Hahella chejuensis (strain KCTC 2396) TaxID=349521 RepID=Q2SCD2_HAHCH|nr:protein containing BNR/Asp-box repeats [Hahella chejuensis KCTC 2396]